jgi:hypothetical protein
MRAIGNVGCAVRAEAADRAAARAAVAFALRWLAILALALAIAAVAGSR